MIFFLNKSLYRTWNLRAVHSDLYHTLENRFFSIFCCPALEFNPVFCVVYVSPSFVFVCFVLFRLGMVLSSLWFTAPDYPFGILKLFLVFFGTFLLAIVLSGLWFTASDYPFGILNLFLFFWYFSFSYCIVWPLIYSFWLPLW